MEEVKIKPKISLIVATKNSESFLQQTINSYKKQTFKNKELIIIDSNSSDNTLNVILKNKHIVNKYISEPDFGISDAWNKGIKISKGDWIIFFGADDEFYNENTLYEISKILNSMDSKFDIAYGKVNVISENNFIIGTYGLPWKQSKTKFNSIMNIPHQGTFHRRSMFDRYGDFNIKLKYAGDYDICFKVFKKSEPFFIPNIIISKMMYGGISSLASHSWKVLIDFGRVRYLNGTSPVTLLWLWYFIKAIFKLILSKLIGDNKTYWLIKFIRDKYNIKV